MTFLEYYLKLIIYRRSQSWALDADIVSDPLDEKYIQLGESTVNTNEESQNLKSNGAFAKVDIPSGTLISHNNGLILSFEEEESMR